MLPDSDEYDQTYVGLSPPFSYFISEEDGLIDNAPILAQLPYPGANYSGMETLPGVTWRLVDTNRAALESAIHDMLQYANYADAIGSGGRAGYIARGLGETEAGASANFSRIKGGNLGNMFQDITLASMVNARAFVPRILNDTGDDVLKSWKALRIHEFQQHEHFQGFFGIPNTTEKPSLIGDGFQCLHLRHYPGYKHASGQKNGRAIPPVIYRSGDDDSEGNWVVNVNQDIQDWLEEAYAGLDFSGLESGQEFWDYVLAISCCSAVENGSHLRTGYEKSIPFPVDFSLYQRIANIGQAMRILQRPGRLSSTNNYSNLQSSVEALIDPRLVDATSQPIQPQNFRIFGLKRNDSMTANRPEITPDESDWVFPDELGDFFQGEFHLTTTEVGEIIGIPCRVRINTTQSPQWISNVPQNVMKFRLGNRFVVQNWLCLHSDIDQQFSPAKATWSTDVSLRWYRELRQVIRNISIMLLLRVRVESLSQQVLDSMLEWESSAAEH